MSPSATIQSQVQHPNDYTTKPYTVHYINPVGFIYIVIKCIVVITNTDGLVCRHLNRMSDLLRNADVDVRICAGEAIALLYELARADDEVSYSSYFSSYSVVYSN